MALDGIDDLARSSKASIDFVGVIPARAPVANAADAASVPEDQELAWTAG